MSTPSPLVRAELQGIGENLNTWGYPRLNNALQRLEEAAHDVVTVDVSGGGTRFLSSTNYVCDESRAPVLIIIGAPLTAVIVIVPSVKHWWIVDNRTSGGQPVTVKTLVGAGYALHPGPQTIFCDGTNVVRASPRLDQVPVPAAPVDMGGQRLVNLPAPAASADAATKAYADAIGAQVAVDRATVTALAATVASDTATVASHRDVTTSAAAAAAADASDIRDMLVLTEIDLYGAERLRLEILLELWGLT
jgi:hypothetical protein